MPPQSTPGHTRESLLWENISCTVYNLSSPKFFLDLHQPLVKVYPEKLEAALNSGLAPIYLLSGEEPRQLDDCASLIRKQAAIKGYNERFTYFSDTLDWKDLLANACEVSLLGDRRLLEVYLFSMPGEAGAKALTSYAQKPPRQSIVMIRVPKIEAGEQKKRWLKAVESAGVWVTAYQLHGIHLQRWARKRLDERNLKIEPEAFFALCEYADGNPDAIAQSIERLCLTNSGETIDTATLMASHHNESHHNVFEFAEAAASGGGPRALAILERLRADGLEPVLILWSLSRQLRIVIGVDTTGMPQRSLSASRALSPRKADRALAMVANLSRRLKEGLLLTHVWDELASLTAYIASGQPLMPMVRARHAAELRSH